MKDQQNISQELRDKAVSKKLRFDVFERDRFTCQYCGAMPPDVLLECDHIQALAKGGKTTIDNLITACEGCNRGKSDRELGHVAVRPDADVMYLKTMQEVAELQRYQSAAAMRDLILAEVCESITNRAWALTDGEWAPSDAIMLQMLSRYGPDVVDQAVAVVAKKIDDCEISDESSSWVPYLWGVAKRIDHRNGGR
jgi:hypothetical protein